MLDNANTIAAQINPPSLGNPFALIGQLAQTQNAINQNKQFEQTFAARQRAGQIMASAPDLETGWETLQRDPLAAPFAGEIIRNARESQLALTKLQGEQQTQAQSALGAAMKSMTGALADPSSFADLMNAQLATMSPAARDRNQVAIQAIQHSLTHSLDGLSDDDARKVYNHRMVGLLMGSGVTPDETKAILGTPETVDTGGNVLTGVRAPAQLGGAFNAATAIPKSLAPQVVSATGRRGQSITTVLGGGQGDNVLFSGPTASEKELLTGMGKQGAQYKENLDSIVQATGNSLQTVGEARNLLKQFTPGGFSSINAKVGQLAQEFGASPDLIDKISNGNLAASQEFQKLMVNTASAQMRQQLGGLTSHATQQEFQTFLNSNPNIDTDPRAIDKIFNFWQKMYGRNHTEQVELNKFLKGGGDVSEWPSKWQDELVKRGWVSDNEPEGGSKIDLNKFIKP